jgi:hypothetical protein
VFRARYALSPYIKQIRFVFKGLKCREFLDSLNSCKSLKMMSVAVISCKWACSPQVNGNYWRLFRERGSLLIIIDYAVELQQSVLPVLRFVLTTSKNGLPVACSSFATCQATLVTSKLRPLVNKDACKDQLRRPASLACSRCCWIARGFV